MIDKKAALRGRLFSYPVTSNVLCATCVFFLDLVAHVAYKKDMNSREVLKRLEKEGFVRVSQRGSHMKLRHEDGRIVIVPHPKKDLPPGTLHNIEEQSKIKF
jgi:predicted RNA binding protein YcfA (HicA-like mRNA interferase family)|uniref:Putative RNA binding protein n=2 Tax=root TaxID=1 RepID=A0A8S5U674_9CAUD|nr:MAG TPA: putative RNA binding protein [Siphoviridae sp. ctwHj1]